MDLNSSGFGHMFPYSNVHELNIDWVLTTVKNLEARTEQIEENIRQIFNTLDDHEQRLVALKQELAELRAAFEAFKIEINERMDNFEAEIRERMTLFEETINNRLTAFEAEVRQIIADFEQRVEERMTQFENSINTRFEQLEQNISTQFSDLEHNFNDRFTALESELRLEIQNNLKYLVDTCAEFTARVVTLEGRVSQIEADMQECCTTITGKLNEVIAELEKLNPSLVEKLITANGTYNALDEGATGFYRVIVDVPNAVLRSVEFTTNGTYTPPAGVDGYNEVVVNLAMQEKTVTQNGEVTPDAGYEGLSKVIVNTPSVVNNQDKTINANGSYTADAGYTGLGTVTVDVPAPAPVIAPLTVTENGTYNAPTGTDGYSPVTVKAPIRVPYIMNGAKIAYVSGETPAMKFNIDGNGVVTISAVGYLYNVSIPTAAPSKAMPANNLVMHFLIGCGFLDAKWKLSGTQSMGRLPVNYTVRYFFSSGYDGETDCDIDFLYISEPQQPEVIVKHYDKMRIRNYSTVKDSNPLGGYLEFIISGSDVNDIIETSRVHEVNVRINSLTIPEPAPSAIRNTWYTRNPSSVVYSDNYFDSLTGITVDDPIFMNG